MNTFKIKDYNFYFAKSIYNPQQAAINTGSTIKVKKIKK